jgi:hypothetical protein
VSFAAITLCVASRLVFVAVYFVIDSVRKLLDTSSYIYIIIVAVRTALKTLTLGSWVRIPPGTRMYTRVLCRFRDTLQYADPPTEDSYQMSD